MHSKRVHMQPSHQEALFVVFPLSFPRNVQDSARSHQKGSILYNTLTAMILRVAHICIYIYIYITIYRS